MFLSDFLEEKIAKENISTQEFFLQRLAKKWRIEICFVFEKSTKMKSKEERFQQYRAQTKSFFFLQQKEDIVFPFFQRSFLFCEK